MGWSLEIGWSYATKLASTPTMAKYYNDTGSKKLIKSFYMYLGTGNATYTDGSTLTGDGSAIDFYVSINGQESSHVSVTTKIGSTYDSTKGYYPTKSQCTKCTVTFDPGVEVAAGATISVMGAYNATIEHPNQVLCVNNSDSYIGGNVVAAETYTIKYNANGGSGAPSSQMKTWGVDLTLTSSKPTTAKAYTITYNANGGSVSPASKSVSCTFASWNTKAAGTGTSYSPGEKYTANADATLYAQWTNNKAGTLATPTRANCIFVGWFTSLNGSSKVTANTIISEDITVYARWQYKIRYYANGGDSETLPETQIKDHRVDITLSDIYPDYDGRTFKGWATSSSATTAEYQPGDTYTENAPLKLYAVWKVPKFKVTFDLRGGTYSGSVSLVQEVEYGKSATVPTPNPTKTNKQFQGWYGDYKNVTSKRTIIALWDDCPIWVRVAGNKWVRLTI